MSGSKKPAEDWRAVEAEGLTPPAIAKDASGEGVTIAIVDSGVNFEHPHLMLPSRGFSIEWSGEELVARKGGHRDLYGHGTCCAALIHLLAPKAGLFAVRVAQDRPTTDADRLAEGIEHAVRQGASIISVALGTETRLRVRLDDAVAHALAAGAVVVAADPTDSGRALPGPTRPIMLPAQSPGALGVDHVDGVDVVQRSDGSVVAEGRARKAPGFPQNFWGASLSTARAAAALARFQEASGARGEALLGGFKKALLVL